MNAAIDVRDVLTAIRVPTLIVHRTDDRLLTIDEGRYVASRIPGATLVELPGEDHLPFVGDQDAILDAIERFLEPGHDAVDADRVLAKNRQLLAAWVLLMDKSLVALAQAVAAADGNNSALRVAGLTDASIELKVFAEQMRAIRLR